MFPLWMDLVAFVENGRAMCEVYFKGRLEEYCKIDCGELLGDLLSFNVSRVVPEGDEILCDSHDDFAHVELPEEIDYNHTNVSLIIADCAETLTKDAYRVFEFSKAFLSQEQKKINIENLKKMMAIFALSTPSYIYAIKSEEYNNYSNRGLREVLNQNDFAEVINRSNNYINEHTTAWRTECYEMGDTVFFLLYFLLFNNFNIKKCCNCDRFFISYNRSDTLYCDRTAPQDNKKTCKEYGAYMQYQNNIRNNAAAKLYRNIYQQKQMQVRRNPDIAEYKSNFETFKSQSKQWKKNVKSNNKTEEEYLEWLKYVKEGGING